MSGISEQTQQAALTWRRRLHKIPELGFEEHETAGAISAYLEGLGWKVTRGLAGTGVLAVKAGSAAGPRLLLRAELDALPMQEETGLDYASTRPGVAHACGHDAHMAMLLGVAAALAESGAAHGDVGLVFQPAEELLGGGQRLLEAGLLRLFDADCCLAAHGWADLPVGVLGFVPGPCLAAIDLCAIRVIGKAGHASAPHKAADPIVAAAELVLSLQAVLSRNLDPMAQAVLTFGKINGGTANNAIANDVALEGTMRYFSPEVGREMAAWIRRRAAGLSEALGVGIEAEIEPCYPVTVNHAGVARWLQGIAARDFGAQNAVTAQPALGSEDFSYYLQERPGAMVFIGAGAAAPLHNPHYYVPDEAILRGVEFYLAVIRELRAGRQAPWEQGEVMAGP